MFRSTSPSMPFTEPRLRLVFGVPEFVVGELAQYVFPVAEILREIDHRIIPGVLDGAAERFGALAEHGARNGICARVAPADDLPVEHDRERDLVRANRVEHEGGFLGGFLGVDRLRIEVNADLQPGGGRPGDVLFKVFVRIDLAGGRAAVADADHRKVDAVGGDLFPVNVVLVLGNIDAGEIFPAGILHPAPAVGRKAVRRPGEHRKAV